MGPAAVVGRPAAERPHDAWRSLPAVQRLVGDPPVVAPAAPFADALATRQPAGLALAPLGHEVSSLATPGLLIGVAAAPGVAGAAAVSGRMDLPLQRHSEAAGPAERAWSSFETDAESSPPGPADQGRAGNHVPAAVAAVQRLAPPAPLLTTAAMAEVRAAPAGRLDLRPAAVATSSPASPAVPPRVVVQRAATATTDGNPLAGQETSTAAPAPARRPTLGEARRLGLGAPLRSASDMRAQRAETGPAGGWQPGMPVVPANVPSAVSVQALADGSAAATAGPSPAEPTGTRPGDEVTRADDLAPVELTVVQPLGVERQRSFPRLDLQRSITTLAPEPDAPAAAQHPGPEDAPGSAGPGPSPDALPVVVARSATREASEPGTAVDAGVHDGSPSWTAPVGGSPIRATSSGWLLRQPAAGPAAPGRAAAGALPPSGAPVVARAVADGARDAGVTGHPLAAQLAALGVTVHQEPAGPLVQRRAAADVPPPEPGSSAPGGVTVVPLQRAVEIGEMQVASTGAASQVGSAAGSTSASTDAAGNPSSAVSRADRERELDELARRLYGRIRSRLASELLADRERAGLLVDLR